MFAVDLLVKEAEQGGAAAAARSRSHGVFALVHLSKIGVRNHKQK
jgi:hypothetical protein